MPGPVAPAQQATPLPAAPTVSASSGSTNDPAAASSGATATPNTTTTSTPHQNGQASASTRLRTDWVPFTLRWYFLLLPIVVSCTLGIVITCLCWYSQRNSGLGKDNGSSAILFGWRFTPTLVAVLYTQITVILFEDSKRTEPFARLANPPPGGAPAKGTLLQKPKAWYSILGDAAFNHKKIGKTSCTLICSTLINAMAILMISPLSSALLASDDVVVSRNLDFTGLVPKNDAQLLGNASRETYFRTMAALTRNISTSAWASDDSITFPVWPASESMQIGPKLVSSHKSWEADTLSLKHEYACEDLTLVSAELQNRTYVASDWHRYKYNGTQPMVSYVFTSRDECKYELDIHPTVDLAYFGGVRWTKATSYMSDGGMLHIDGYYVPGNVSSQSPYSRIKASPQCEGRDAILVGTPWTSPLELPMWESILPNRTYERSPQFRMRGLLCKSTYVMRRHTAKVSMTSEGAVSLESYADEGQEPEPIPQTLMNLTQFQEMALGWNQWELYTGSGTINDDSPSRLAPDAQDPTTEKKPQNPHFVGFGIVLGTLSSWNVTSMLDDPDFAKRAARIKGRFFTENIRDAFTKDQMVRNQALQGKTASVETRVVVLREIGIVLATLFFISFGLFLMVLWSSRVARRPLNLSSDPASTVGMSMLLDPRLTSLDTIRRAHSASKRGIHAAVRQGSFFTSSSTLYEDSSTSSSHIRKAVAQKKSKLAQDWRPHVIRLKSLFALGTFLATILAALLVLSAFSNKSHLYQKAFTYETDLSHYGLSISSFAPISIGPTVISIAITLWWDQLDMTFRILQPYIAMSRAPTPIKSGAGLTYRSKTWMGAVFKAAKHRHWVLFLVALGSTLSQVLTVSMSALFERKSANSLNSVVLNKTLEARYEPVLTTIDVVYGPDVAFKETAHSEAVLDAIYSGASNNWLYDATIQLSLGGTQLPWTRDEWNFVPVDIPAASSAILTNSSAEQSPGRKLGVTTNVTLQTTAVRARLECNQVDALGNRSTWLKKISEEDFPVSTNIEGLKSGYVFPHFLFENTSSSTSILGSDRSIQCCMNGTTSDPQEAVVGYWSPLQNERAVQGYPYQDRTWPMPFITKWIVGKPTAWKNYDTDFIIFEDPPSLQAAFCQPVFESTEANIAFDTETRAVHTYELLREPEPIKSAWSDVFVRHDFSDSERHYEKNYTGKLNITTSFGVLFLDAIFGGADRGSNTESGPESLSDNVYNIREQGLGFNMDLMTYSMFTLGDKDSQALLNYTTLTMLANQTFQTFFQHFANNKLSTTEDSWAYQKIGDKSLDGLGRAIDENGTAIAERIYIRPATDPTVTATVSRPIQILHMNSVATYLSAGLVIWLIVTTTIVTCLQRRYIESMLRHVELIADVLVLVAGSGNFLSLVQEKGVSLKRDAEVKTMLGWFKDHHGEVRWGVEVVGGRNPVEWVTAPRKDFG